MTSNATTNGNGADGARHTRASPKTADAAGIWVEKLPDRFTIYAAWAARNAFYNNHDPAGNPVVRPMFPSNNRSGNHFAGFAVFNNELFQKDATQLSNVIEATGMCDLGVAIYPTIQFQVVGIPRNFRGNNNQLDLSVESPRITLA